MRLDEYLDRRGIPIARFAKRCGLTYPQVRHILKGNAPTLESALRIFEYTEGEVAPDELISKELWEEIYKKKYEEKDQKQQVVYST